LDSSLLDARLEFYPCSSLQGTVRYRSESGASYLFTPSGGGQARTEGLHATFDSESSAVFYDSGLTLSFGFSAGCSRFLTFIADRNGNTIIIQRDVNGAPSYIVDTYNRTIQLSPGENGLISDISPPGGLASITYSYDRKFNHQLNTVVQGDQTTTYHYGPDNRLKSIEDPRGFLTKFSYHSSPGCGERARTIEFGREVGGTPESFDTYTYTCPQKTAPGAPTVSATVKDPNAHVTTYMWHPMTDPGPRLVTDALGRETHLSYEPFYFDISRSTKCLQETQFDYNENGTLRSLSRRFSASDSAECGDFSGGELVSKLGGCRHSYSSLIDRGAWIPALRTKCDGTGHSRS
jgi:hypothetical protein